MLMCNTQHIYMIILYYTYYGVHENVLARNAPGPSSFPTNNPVNSNNNYYYRSRPGRLVGRRRAPRSMRDRD